jgi:arabinofuranosyltransferase
MTTRVEHPPAAAEATRAPGGASGGGRWRRLAGRLRDPRTLLRLGLLAVPVVVVLVMGWSRRWTADDGFINFRVVDMIRHGHGPVFNPGARVEAETSPLWVAMLVVGDVILPLRLEWVAVFLALGLMVSGLVVAEIGAAGLWRRVVGDRGVLLPAGVLVFAALAPVWDFSTAGLDTGLAVAWLGAVWWCLCRTVGQPPRADGKPRTRWWVALIVGLGPLVRPDLLIMTIAFLVVLVVAEATPRFRVRAVVWVAAVPVAYQIFRMAYYAAVVPNTALAKEASTSDWSRGWTYFTDFVTTYQWWIPLALLIAVGVVPLLRAPTVRGSRPLQALIVAPLVAGAVHAIYVIRVGGDFMHARMLLPSLWCALLPGAVIVVRSWRWAGAAGIAAWVIVCGFFLRVGYIVRDTTHSGKIGPVSSHALITNERAEFIRFSNRSNPVTLDDYRHAYFVWVRAGEAVRARAQRGERGVLVDGFDPSGPLFPIRPGLTTPPIIAFATNIGMYGYAVGPEVYVVDRFGIADPIAGRLAIKRGTAGHEKIIDRAWEIARFVDPAAAPRTPAVLAAQRALGCDDLPKLLRDVDDPLTVSQAWHNFWDSPGLTSIRFTRSPIAAARQLCGR